MDSYKHYIIPPLKKVELDLGSSLKYSRYTKRQPDAKAYWHYHPEVELVFIKEGSGKRYVGNHISNFQGGDLLLIGPNIPHFGYDFGLHNVNKEIVVQFKYDIIKNSAKSMPELKSIESLIEKSKAGIAFHGKTKEAAGRALEAMHRKNQFERLLCLLKILESLSKSEEYKLLNAAGMTLLVQNMDDDRIDRVYQFVKENYDLPIQLSKVCQLVNMTEPAFCRFFKKYTKKTFTQFVNEFRIKEAMQQISAENKSITEIAIATGFNNFSHFNKQFKKFTGVTASTYKKSLFKIIK